MRRERSEVSILSVTELPEASSASVPGISAAFGIRAIISSISSRTPAFGAAALTNTGAMFLEDSRTQSFQYIIGGKLLSVEKLFHQLFIVAAAFSTSVSLQALRVCGTFRRNIRFFTFCPSNRYAFMPMMSTILKLAVLHNRHLNRCD